MPDRLPARNGLLLTWLLPALLLVALAGGVVLVDRINDERFKTEARIRVSRDVNDLRGRLEQSLVGELQLVRGLQSVISVNPQLTQDQFARAARPLFRSGTRLRNIAAAPDMVIRLMYPVQGNEKAIGIDYRNIPAQYEAVERARQTGEIVLAGPLTLIQGGTGLIARLPVYLPEPGADDRFWGIVSAVIDAEQLFAAGGLHDVHGDIKVALRGRDGRGANGDVFFGDASVFDADPVYAEINLPLGSWQLAAIPKSGWPAHADNYLMTRMLLASFMLVVLGVFMFVAYSLRKVSLAQVEAQAATVAKSQFLANMSHEIRTPINAILGMLKLLQGTSLDARQADYVGKTSRAAKSLLGLIDDILDFSKVEAGKMALDLHPFRLDDLMRDLSAILTANLDGKPVELGFTMDAGLQNIPVVLGDSLRLRQVLINLGGNALKFTERGSVVVSVRLVEQDKQHVTLRFSVKDTGLGIAPENQRRIFAGFTQAEASTTRRFGGSGLGLSISSRLVEMMGGVLTLDSELGKGSDFHFEIPLAVSELPVTEGASDGDKPPTDLRRLDGMRVLLVEDNHLNQQVAQELLSREGARVVVASNGEAGVQAVAAASPQFDAVLMDVQMPVMDGYMATRAIRGQLGLTTLPVIAMTANVMDADRQAGAEAGMNDHVSKPFDLDELVAVLLRHTGFVPDENRSMGPVGHVAPVVGWGGESAENLLQNDKFELRSAVQRMGGALALYDQLLRGFCLEAASGADRVGNYLASGDAGAALKTLHTLKGLAGTVGAKALATRLAVAEGQLKQGIGASEQAAWLLALEVAFSEALAVLGPLSAALQADREADAAATSDVPQGLVDGLRALHELLKSGDMSALVMHAELRSSYADAQWGQLDVALADLDFDRAARECQALIPQTDA